MITLLLFLIALALAPYWLPPLFALIFGLAYIAWGFFSIIFPLVLGWYALSFGPELDPAGVNSLIVIAIITGVISIPFYLQLK